MTARHSAHSVCVFCGSAFGERPVYREAAAELGRELGARSLGLVYGGATVGLMGMLADAALAAGAPVAGVIPRTLVEREIAHRGLTNLYEVETMHERKALMASLASGFVALPGGYGTLDEFMEILTWAQLRIHAKPCVLLNVAGYFDGLLAFLDRTVEEGFLKPQNRTLVRVAASVSEALAMLGETWRLSASNVSGLSP